MFGFLKHYFLIGYEKGKQRYYNNDIILDQSIIDEVAMLEIVIERKKETAAILEKELENTFDNKKKVVLLNKINTLDQQVFKLNKKLNYLKDG